MQVHNFFFIYCFGSIDHIEFIHIKAKFSLNFLTCALLTSVQLMEDLN